MKPMPASKGWGREEKIRRYGLFFSSYRAMARLCSGTDGVRGPYGGPVINGRHFAARPGRGCRALDPEPGPQASRVLISRDTPPFRQTL